VAVLLSTTPPEPVKEMMPALAEDAKQRAADAISDLENRFILLFPREVSF
jgi:hypothetical protein